MKAYTHPLHILDTSFVIFKLDDGKLSIERHYFASMLLATEENSLTKSTEGFTEVDPFEFTTICEWECTTEEFDKFTKEYESMFK